MSRLVGESSRLGLTDSFGYSKTQVIPVARWACWEWQMDGEIPQKCPCASSYTRGERRRDYEWRVGERRQAEARRAAVPKGRASLGWQFWHDDANKHLLAVTCGSTTS